jgi:hypothetical protein
MEENELITLKLIGFNEESRNNFCAVLTLADRALNKKWQITQQDEADFFLLSVQSSATANRDKLLKGLFAERCLFCTKDKTTQENELQVDENHLPRLSMLVALFNKISAQRNLAAKPLTIEQKPHLSNSTFNAETFFDPHQGLLGYVLAAKHELMLVNVKNQPQQTALYIDTDKNVYYSKQPLEQLDIYLVNSDTVNITPASKIEIKNIVTLESLKPLPLKNLIWYIVMKTSAGRPLKGHAASTIVTLKSWPDLRLFKCLDYAKVATFMKNNSAPLKIIAEQTTTPLAELNNFYNACYLIGLIESKNQIEINKKNISPERLNLLNKIDARLK